MNKNLKKFGIVCGGVFLVATVLAVLFVLPKLGAERSQSLKFREAVSRIIAPYSVMQRALAADDLTGVKEAMPDLRSAVEEFGKLDESGLFDPKQQSALERVQNNFRTTAILSDPLTDIKSARRAFRLLALEVQIAVEIYGHAHYTPIYQMFCPMAFDNEGAYWLQTSEKIRNPYFGKEMLECGEVKKVFPARE